MANEAHPLLVQAIYSFQGKNNDELCFKKGDIITVTQKEEGGWWEGTLATTDKTGWFPSNYVKEYKLQDTMSISKGSGTVQMPVDLTAQQKAYRNLVLRDIIDSEKANVAELQTLVQNFLHPLENAGILPREEYRQLVSNMDEILAVQQHLLAALEDCATKLSTEQRVGRVFLTNAPRMKQVHQTYCAAHPKAVCVIDKYKDELNSWMESAGASIPGILVLTTGLSKPFRRLDKYASMLQELERHVEENHPDRGDTQRSVSIFKDIASVCSTTRRQKELELEVLTGGVRGWEGEDLQILGDIVHMGSVAVGPDHRDRYLVLFPTTLLMLSVSQRMSAFIYEGKLPLTGITVNKLENTDNYKNAFEIVGPLIERIVAVCQTREDQQSWVDILRQQIRCVLHKSSSPKSPIPPPHGNQHQLIVTRNSSNISRPSNLNVNHNINNINNNHLNAASINNINNNNYSSNSSVKIWTATNLRPAPPVRITSTLTRDDIRKSTRGPRKINDKSYEEDALVLRVIESYCTSAKTRSTISSALLESPSEKGVLSSVALQADDKNVLDAVNALNLKVNDLQGQINTLMQQLDYETSARRSLQNVIHAHITSAQSSTHSSLPLLVD
ncbi:rho guanine nucleotide exchange factor 7 isoform X1 [Thrips palmi]|uniref:Rho guanine nucleotide exchange factor 7 isoform X1 n=1 Tax=Thrips palmi TaxID=161013 RepID=A0A6P9A4D3_THRPL|nr:rho guanine nucleotide exchange factor 7 isoform X1 [Thrips palmi]XP_034252100.1 rho guanine nucleotide exchange factor 7 isoform X1 [Thrips palmi]